jgi:hypothetical protein
MLEKYNLDHEVDCFVPDRELTEAEREKVVVVENGHFGVWNYDLLSGFSIDIGELDLDISIPADINPSEIDLPDLGDGSDPDIQQVTFTLSNEQKDVLDEAMEKAKKNEDCIDEINQNKNGNILAAILRAYVRC